ncbi:MAG: redoxin domain-containing protein [Acidobacteria bacterium]|nr:redoxin domain-containing protein [Acidobacteriota bacterium]
MAQVESRKDEIRQLGGQLVYIAAEKRNGIWKPEKYLRAHPVSFPFLLDEDRSVAKAYGLYHRLAHDAFKIAYPATLVITQDQRIEFIYRGASQTDRAALEEVMSVLRKLKSDAG